MILYKHKKNTDTAVDIIDIYYENDVKKALVNFYNIRPEYYENEKPFPIGLGTIRLKPRREYVKIKF